MLSVSALPYQYHPSIHVDPSGMFTQIDLNDSKASVALGKSLKLRPRIELVQI